MTRLGDLERAVMDVLWDVVPGTSDGVTVREVADALDGRELAELCTLLKQRCGTGGTVKDGRIEIQGDARDRVAAELERLGYRVKRVGG